MSALPVLEVADLALWIGDCLLIEALTLTIRPGERWCLLGPNGAGKTCLLEALVGLSRPLRGSVCYGGQPLEQLGARSAALHRAYLPQHWHDAFDATVFELASAGRHPHLRRDGWESSADCALVSAALATLGLSGLAQRKAFALSGGERQRVALAAVLAQQARLLLLDEPLNHLDLRQQQQVLQALTALTDRGEVGLLCSVHDLNVAERFATHIVLIDGRGSAWTGARADILSVERLSSVFGIPIECLDRRGQRWWMALPPP
jgi:iron complex transport system ATP-binding protein